MTISQNLNCPFVKFQHCYPLPYTYLRVSLKRGGGGGGRRRERERGGRECEREGERGRRERERGRRECEREGRERERGEERGRGTGELTHIRHILYV